MITADLLKRIPLFAGIPDDERASLAARAADVRLNADEWLILEGQTPSFFALLEGRLAVEKNIAGRDQQLTVFEPGDYFGEVPLLLASPAVASVRALEPARVARLDPLDFHDLISHCRVLNSEIMKTMAQRVGSLQQIVVDTPMTAATLIGRQRDRDCLEAPRVSRAQPGDLRVARPRRSRWRRAARLRRASLPRATPRRPHSQA